MKAQAVKDRIPVVVAVLTLPAAGRCATQRAPPKQSARTSTQPVNQAANPGGLLTRPMPRWSSMFLGAARDYVETVRGVGYRFAEAPLT